MITLTRVKRKRTCLVVLCIRYTGQVNKYETRIIKGLGCGFYFKVLFKEINPFSFDQKERSYSWRFPPFFVPLKSGLGKFPKISLKRIQVRFSTGYVEVITEKLEPHLNHVPRNSLIINEFNILHRKVISLN